MPGSKTWVIAAALGLSAMGVCAHAQTNPQDSQQGALDNRLLAEARLDWITAYALVRSPVLAEASARARAGAERASAAGRLPDPELKYEQWAVPLTRPYALSRADTLMVGLRQAFPAAGTRRARAQVTEADREIAGEQRRATERELLRRIRRAYFDYYSADQTLRLSQEHIALTEQMLAQLRGNYELGRATQQDVLKALVELSRLHSGLAEVVLQHETSRFLLNTLMGRATDAPLGSPVAVTVDNTPPPRVQELEQQLTDARPELSVARSVTRRSLAAAEGSRLAARRPAFVVGADYWLMPTLQSPHAYGAMVSMSLPWLNPEHRAEARAAEQNARADLHAQASVHRMASLELHQAAAGWRAAAASLSILERELLPQAEQSVAATRSAFEVGQGDLLSLLDAQRSFFQVRIEHSRAYARVMSQLAELEFVSGARLFAGTRTEGTP